MRRSCPWILLLGLVFGPAARAVEPPAWLPRYDLDIHIDPAQRLAKVRERVTFTNRTTQPTSDIVFNVHGYFTADGQVGFLAKMAEILRMSPKESMYFDGAPLTMNGVVVLDGAGKSIPNRSETAPHPCAMKVILDREVNPGESVTVDLDFTFKIPAKKGRWSSWEGITTLAQWLPTLAVHDEKGWHAMPFIPWHQPFYNEAGVYTARVTLPTDQLLACACPVRSEHREDGCTRYELEPTVLRDFSLTCSARYVVTECQAGRVKIRCLHLPEHKDYARLMTTTACDALPIYETWFGPYPYSQFVIAEACFGWNGNECGGMVLVDDRMFNMSSIARNYTVYLIQHELCHQWWYNVIGTNGYAETFMDEGMATYFSHRLADRTLGKNNPIIEYPNGLKWLPNIHRDDLRLYGITGARRRGDLFPTVQPVDKFGHLPNLLAYTYDRGGKIIGLIEQRMGETAFLDFMRTVYRKYYFRILLVADFQRELEEYTGRSWDEFFRHWVHGSGACDWKVSKVRVDGRCGPLAYLPHRRPVDIVVELVEQEGFPEPTVLGVKFGDHQDYALRIPVDPSVPELDLPDQKARVECSVAPDCQGRPRTTVRISFSVSESPRQIVVDPDHVLLDMRPENNAWVPTVRWRMTPLYTQLEELDVTNSYDRWNVIFGPWLWTPTNVDPWYQRSALGVKLGVYRTQELVAGTYLGYRSNDRNIVGGADVLWDHFPLPRTQVGATIEHSLSSLDNAEPRSRAAIWARYVFTYSSSLFLPPFEYAEAFAQVQHHPLPDPRVPTPGANHFDQRNGFGLHYHKFLLTPYWDAEGGAAVDVNYQYGVEVFGQHEDYHLTQGQVSTVKGFPDWLTLGEEDHLSAWPRETRFAFRLGGGAASRRQGQFFSLGGGDQFRGFDVRERQGSLAWVASVERRVPVVQNTPWDFCDKIIGIRNVYLAPFYDAGNAYLFNRPLGDTAHALGLGLRIDVQWLGIIERTMLRADVAKTVNADTPWQFWFGVQHPF